MKLKRLSCNEFRAVVTSYSRDRAYLSEDTLQRAAEHSVHCGQCTYWLDIAGSVPEWLLGAVRERFMQISKGEDPDDQFE